jgi:integrase
MMRHLGFVTGRAPATPQCEVAWAWLVAQHTAMRAGQVLAVKRSTVDQGKKVVTLHSHKTLEREGVRFVPFTKKAARVLAVLDVAARAAGRDAYFTISGHSLDVLFRRVRDRLLIEGLHFHDSRADALTRLAKRMDILRLSRISGHRDLKQLGDAYYRATAAEIAASI